MTKFALLDMPFGGLLNQTPTKRGLLVSTLSFALVQRALSTLMMMRSKGWKGWRVEKGGVLNP